MIPDQSSDGKVVDQPVTTRRFVAVVNPIAGGGAAAQRWAEVRQQLQHDGHRVDTIESQSRAHAIASAKQAAIEGNIVVAVGGDGTVRDVVNGVAPTGGTIAVVPSGRGNDLAEVLRIPTATKDLASLMSKGPTRSIDLIQVGTDFVPGNVYVGLDGRSTDMINRFRWVPAGLLYRLAPFLATIGWRRFTATIESSLLGDSAARTSQSIRAHMVVIANSGRYGHGLQMVPTASVDDGQLDVLVVRGVNVLRLTSLMPQATRGTHMNRPDISTWPATHATISADRPLPYYADGEKIGMLPCTVSIRPAMLNIIAPTTPPPQSL